MVYQLKAYGSVSELLGSVSTEIEHTRIQLQRVREASNDMRKRSERAKRLQQAFLNGSQQPTQTASKGIRMGELDVVVNAGTDEQLLALDLMIRAQNDRLTALQKIQDSLTKLESRGQPEILKEISCLVIEDDGVPKKLMFQDKSHFESAAVASLFPSSTNAFQTRPDYGSKPEHTKLGDVQLEMASIARESDTHPDSIESNQVDRKITDAEVAPRITPEGRLSGVLRFVTAKP